MNGRGIRNLREQAGLTQLELATRVDMTRVAINRIECGRTQGRRSTLRKIVLVLACPDSRVLVVLKDPKGMDFLQVGQAQGLFTIHRTMK